MLLSIFLPHTVDALLELFGRICTNSGQMQTPTLTPLYTQCVYAEVNALFMHLHKLHSDITEPHSVYHSYQHTIVITLTASLALPFQRLNFTDKTFIAWLAVMSPPLIVF